VVRTLARYRNSKAVQHALVLAADLLNYRPRREYSWELQLETQVARLRDGGVTPRELLAKICSVWALNADRERFRDAREFTYGIANEVLKLRKLGTWRPGGVLLSRLGQMIVDDLGSFAAGVWVKTQQDTDSRAEAHKAFSTGWQLDGE
jgi:hypothetical protein